MLFVVLDSRRTKLCVRRAWLNPHVADLQWGSARRSGSAPGLATLASPVFALDRIATARFLLRWAKLESS